MFRPTLLRCSLVVCLMAFATTSMWAQTGSKSAEPAKTAAKKFRGRLPNGYGKLGLDQKQKTAIYKVQEKFHGEIEALEAQIDALKAKQSEEILAILTAEQKAALNLPQNKSKTTTKAGSTKKTTAEK